MSHEQKHLKHDELDSVNEALSRSEQFIQNNQKVILTSAVVIILLATAIISIRQFVLLPREAKAQAEMVKGPYYFEMDSLQIALNGNGADFIGFEAIVDQYGYTDAANLAKAYAGVSHMRLGNYTEAIACFEDFDADDQLVSPAIIGAIGDCYVNMDKVAEGIKYFEKAAKNGDNPLIAPIYLKKAGIAYLSLSKFNDAANVFQTIKEKYPNTAEGSEIDKYIEKAKLGK